MVGRNNLTSLKLESLEAREVPAIVLAGTLSGGVVTANGGNVVINEIGGTFEAYDPAGGAAHHAFTRANTNADIINMTGTGGTLLITDTDGIFVQTAGPFPDFMGTVLTVSGVTGLTVNLQLGGDDIVTDGTDLTATINGGPGNDKISAPGSGAFNYLLYQLLHDPNFTPTFPFLQALANNPGQKILNGNAGDDTLIAPAFGFLTQLSGGDGNDFLVGGSGVDVMDGGNGIDILLGFGGKDIYITNDGGLDLLGNQMGDIVLSDAIDIQNRI